MSESLVDLPAHREDSLKTGRFARSCGQRGKQNGQTECEEKPFVSSHLVSKKGGLYFQNCTVGQPWCNYNINMDI